MPWLPCLFIKDLHPVPRCDLQCYSVIDRRQVFPNVQPECSLLLFKLNVSHYNCWGQRGEIIPFLIGAACCILRLFPCSLPVFSLSGQTASVLWSFTYRSCFLESWRFSLEIVQGVTISVISVNLIVVTPKTKFTPGFLNAEQRITPMYITNCKLGLYFCNLAPCFPALQSVECWFSLALSSTGTLRPLSRETALVSCSLSCMYASD